MVSNTLAWPKPLHPSIAFAVVGSSLCSLYWLPEVEDVQTTSMCVHCNFPATCVTNYTVAAAAPLGLLTAIESSWALVEQCSLSPHPRGQ